MSRGNGALSISVHNAQRTLGVDLAKLQQFANAALRECIQAYPQRAVLLRGIAEISVMVISDRRIAGLHRRFMQIAGPTDVITFQHGEIYLSIQTAARQAAEFKNSLDRELQLYVVHGILHLLGFDDQSTESAQAMAAAQEAIVARVSGSFQAGSDASSV